MVEDTNGWPEYKKTVVYQLEFLTKEVKEIRDIIIEMDKNIKDLVTRDRLEQEINNLHRRRETDIALLGDKRELDLAYINKSREEFQILSITRMNAIIDEAKKHSKENDDWKLEVATTIAADKARNEQSRKAWTIVTVAVSLAINIIGLLLAFLIKG